MRGQTYNEAGFYRICPVHRFQVVPGESASLAGQVQVISAAFEKPIMTGGQMIVAAFYTPFRLLWDGWVDFVTQGDFSSSSAVTDQGAMSSVAATVPQTTVPWPLLFEAGAGTAGRQVHSFGRRAYKLIVNEFFGDANVPRSRYADILDDTDITQKPTRNLDQWISQLVMSGDVESPSYNVPVVSNQVAINLDALRVALVRQKSMKRRDLTGDKYVDALMRMGVKLDWRVQQAPECLGVWKGDFNSSLIKSTASTETGKMVGQFKGTVPFQSGRKFFAEHGIVWLVAICKPHVFFPTNNAPDAQVTSKNQMFFGDNQVGTGGFSMNFLEPGAGTVLQRQFAYLHAGRSFAGQQNAESWIPQASFDAQATIDEILYPSGVSDALLPQLGFGGLAFCTDFNHSMVLPFKKGII